jgi:UTP-glucose-1-phosphate uridylyltransferase
LINRAVVPAAGLGTRLLAVTRSVPKEMLPVVDRPVVQYVVDELARSGIERVLLVTNPRKRAIEDHFARDGDSDGPEISFAAQPHPAGLGDAVRRGEEFAGSSRWWWRWATRSSTRRPTVRPGSSAG